MDSLIENLRAAVGSDGVISEPDELLVYECDALTHYRARPRAVVFPRSTEEASEVVRVLHAAGVPFAPRGAGTGLSGGALALRGGVLISLARMRRILKLDAENRLAVVETGIVNAHLTRAAAPFGLHYAPDPSSQATCTVGGNIAENAGGIHCLKYGVTVDHVLAARVVLSDGEVVELNDGGAGAGFDLLGVFVGSEGTFGLATEATVRLTPTAPHVVTLLADFTNIDDASRAVSDIIASGLIPAALEMVDGATIRAVEASVFAAGLPPDAEAALLVELDGLEAGLDEEAARAREICLKHGARAVRRAADEHERKRLWAARKGAFGAMGRITPDLMLQDAVVPRSRLPEVLASTYRVGEKYALKVANVFHAGDGNLHPYICYDARKAEEVERVHAAGREIMEACVAAGGTITGEHGVGLDKSAYLPLIFSADDLDAMRRVRVAFDPAGLCNPGKVLPAPPGCGEARAVAEKAHRAEVNNAPTLFDAPQPTREDKSITLPTPLTTSVSTSRTNDSAPPVLHRQEASISSSSILASTRARVSTSLLSEIVGAENIGELPLSGVGDVLTVAPGSVEEVSEVLRLAERERWKVVPAGAGTWLDISGTLRRADVVIKTSRLSQIVSHEPADLVATAQAGVTLDALNSALASAGQCLPLDPPDDGRATLGGVVASGLAGAQSFGYGAPRSFVLGMRVALAGGRMIKAGGRVVKNVAGYDMCKLFTGSCGTLGIILELTFKLRPRPAREATVLARASDLVALCDGARDLLSTRLLPVAVELLSPSAARAVLASESARGYALMVRFAGSEKAIEYQLAQAHSLLRESAEVHAVETREHEAQLWRNLSALPLRHASTHDGLAALIWRARVLPTRLGSLITETEARLAPGALWHAGLADGRLRVVEPLSTRAGEQTLALNNLRDSLRNGGSLVVESAPPGVKQNLGAWCTTDAAYRLMRRIKQQLDAADTFSPGRM